MKLWTSLAALVALPALVAAHFTLDYPPSRGFDEDTEPRECVFRGAAKMSTVLRRSTTLSRVLRRLLHALGGAYPLPPLGAGPRPDRLAPPVRDRRHVPLVRLEPDQLQPVQPDELGSAVRPAGPVRIDHWIGRGACAHASPREGLMTRLTHRAHPITAFMQFCFRVDVASLGVSGIANGSVATLQCAPFRAPSGPAQCSLTQSSSQSRVQWRRRQPLPMRRPRPRRELYRPVQHFLPERHLARRHRRLE